MENENGRNPLRGAAILFACRVDRLFDFRQTFLDGFQLGLQGLDLNFQRLLLRGWVNGFLPRKATLRPCREKAVSAATTAAKPESSTAEPAAMGVSRRCGTGAISGAASCHGAHSHGSCSVTSWHDTSFPFY